MADYDYEAELKKKQKEEEYASETDSTDDSPADESEKPTEEAEQAERKKLGGPGYQIQFIRQEAPGEEPPPETKTDEQVTAPSAAAAPSALPEPTPSKPLDTITNQQVVALPPEPSTKVIAPPQIEGDPGQIQEIQAPEDVTHHYQELPTPPPVAPSVPETPEVKSETPEVKPEPAPPPTPSPTPNVQVGTMEDGKFVSQDQPPVDQKPAAPPVKIPETLFGINRIDKEAADAKPSGIQSDDSGADNTGTADYFRKRGDDPITSENDPRLTQINIHGRKWNVNKEAAPYFKGFLQELADQGAPMRSDGGWNFRNKVGASGLSTHSWAGAVDVNQDGRGIVTPQFQKWLQQHPGALQAAERRWHIYGGERFGDLGHFEWGGVGGQPDAASVSAGDQGGDLKGYITTKATQFGHFDPDDAGVGAPRLGTLDTNDPRLIGLAVPEEQLRRQFGNHPEAWRRARADVVLSDGTHVMVPIVDIGPGDEPLSRGVGVDFTYGMSKLVGHQDEKSTYKVKLVGDAGPDVEKDPRAFIREQASLAKNGPQARQQAADKYSIYGGERVEVLNNGANMSPAEKVSQETAQMYQNQPVYEQWHKLDAINVAQGGNRAKTLDILSKPIEGINDNLRQDYLSDYKKDLVEFMRVHTNNPDLSEEDAVRQATASPNIGSFTAEVVNRFLPNIQKSAMNLVQGFDTNNENIVQQYAKLIEPDATEAQLKAFKDHLLSVPRSDLPALLAEYQTEIYNRTGTLPIEQERIFDAVKRLGDPGYQANREKMIQYQAELNSKLASSPNFEGTAAGKVANFLSQAPATITQIMGGPIGEYSMISDIYAATEERIRHDHPDWDDDQVRQRAGASTMAQWAPAAIGLRAAGGKISKWFSGIEKNPNMFARIGMSGALHGGIGAAAGAGQSILANLAENKDINLQEAGEQALFGGVQGAVGGMIGGIHRRGNVDHIPLDERLPSDNDRIEKPDENTPPPDEPRPTEPTEPRPTEPTEPSPTEPRPTEPRPTEPVTGDVEDQLNKQNEELLNPVEEKSVPADITKDAGRETEVGPAPEKPGKPGTEDERRDAGQKPSGDGYPTPGSGEDVPEKLGRVPGRLESQLSPEERAALQPLVDAVAAHPKGTAPAKAAYQKLFEAVYQKFAPLFKAAGSVRNDRPTNFDGIAAAGYDSHGKLEHSLNHKAFEKQVRWNIDQGNDPANYIHSVLHEELTHHAEQLASRDEWNRTKAKTGEDFVQHKFRRSREVIDDFIAARDQARAKGNHALADEMDQALHQSIQMYHQMGPQEAEGHFQDLYRKAKAGGFAEQNDLANIASELVRQMVQLRHSDTTEHFFHRAMGAAVEWFQRAISGLKSLYAKLGPGQVLAKTELAKLIRATERKLETLVRQAARKEKPIGSKTADLGREIQKTQVERALTGTVTKPTKKEIGRNWLTKFSTMFKGGESTMLDQGETRGLARLIRQRPSLEQKIGSNIGIHHFYEAWDSVRGKADKARVTQEIGDYMKAREKGQPLPPISKDTQTLVKAWDDLAHATGGEMDRLNVHVKDSKGKVRKFNRLGYGKYFPHAFSADFKDMMAHRDGARKADFDARVASEVAAGKVKDRNEFIDRYANSNTSDLHSNEPFSNQERAREGGFNIDDMDVSPEGMMRYANRSVRRLAQIEAYGQKLSDKGKDAFDHTIKRVNDSSHLTPRQKEMITTRIMQEQNAEYSNRHKDNHSDMVGHISQVASGAFLGNPITSVANLIGGGAHNLAVGGLGSFAKALMKLPKMGDSIKEAYERGILRENLSNLMRNYEQVGDQNWMTHGVQGFNQKMLKWGGQHLTENINRAFAMEQGKEYLKEFYRGYGQDNAKMRWIYNQLEQLGISKSEQADLYRERGTGTVTNEFLRQWVMETHGNYGPSQTASHIFDSPAGKMLGQFQKWGVNAGRLATRQFVSPLIRAGVEVARARGGNHKALEDFGYHLGRNLFFLGTAMGAGSLQQIGRDWMMRRQSNDPTYDDILKRFAKGDNRAALGESIHKMWDTVILSGMTGQFGNYGELVRQLDPSQNNPGRIKDPMHPPALGILQPWLQFGQTALTEGGIRGKTVDTLIGQLISGYRTMKPMVQEAGGALGIPGLKQGAQSLTAQNQINFLRAQTQQYAEEHPEIKRAVNIPFTPSAFSPVRDAFHSALIRGDSIEANAVINHYLGSLPPGERAGALKSIKGSIQQSAPIKVGGSVALPEATAFLQWAKENLPEPEARQLFASARTYALAAMQTSIFDGAGAKAMRYLSKLDYDKFGGPVQKKAQSAAAESNLRHFYQKSQAAQQLPQLRQ